ncbi:MAG: TolB family protein [Chloroflexota bacterium]
METENQINETKPKDGSAKIPLIIFSVLGLCALGSLIIFCGVAFLFTRVNGNLTPILATPVPTVDLVQETNADPSWEVAFSDEFASNANHWDVSPYENDNVKLTRKISGGKYIWEFNAKTGWNFWESPNMKTVRNFVASLEITHTQGSTFDDYGMILRVSGGNYYFFRVDENGRYTFGYRYLEEYTTLLAGERANLIRPGQLNRLTVKAIDKHFSLYINNVPVGEVDDDKFSSGKVGIFLSPSGSPENLPKPDAQDTSFSSQTGYPSRFELENLQVWSLVSGTSDNKAEELPPLEPGAGQIVFVSTRDGNSEIYSIQLDGNDVDRLTNNPADDFSPKWSPDGRQIAFVSTREGDPEIFVMNRDGSKMTRLTNDPADDLDPSWSPDGQKIVFASNRSGNYNLYVLDVSTKSVERLTEIDSNERYPDWSPDRKTVLFQSDRGFGINLFTADVETQKVKQVTFDRASSIHYPIWAPNGKSMLYQKYFGSTSIGLVVRDHTTNKTSNIISLDFQNDLWPAWSPDGLQIAFVSNRDGQTDIYIINKDGTAIYRLTDDPAVESELDWTAE